MIKRHRGEQLTLAATGSISLAQVRNIPPGFNVLEVDPFHATTVEALLLAFGPKMLRVWFYKATAPAASRWIDLTEKLTNRNAPAAALAGSGAYLNGMTANDALYICFTKAPRGVGVNVQGANAVASTGTWSYLSTENAWVDLSASDGTASGGATFAIDGLVTWTLPAPERWGNQLPPNFDTPIPDENLRGFWVRFTTSATFTIPTNILEIVPLANTNANSLTVELGEPAFRIITHNAARPMDRFVIDTQRYGAIEITSTALTSAINLNWYEER